MPTVTIPALGQFGLIADQPSHELPPNGLSNVDNIRFRDGSAESTTGHVSIFTTPSVTPYWIAPYGTATARYWIHSGIASTFADDGTTRTDITGTALTGAIDDRFTGGSLSGVFVLNNGIDPPKYWDGNTANNLTTLTAWDANWRVKFMRPFRNYLVYGFPTKSGTAYPHTVGWSAAADPGTVPTTYDTASTTTDAGDVPLGETPDQLVDCLPLGEVNIIYKEQSMYRMEYVGGQQVFAFRRIPGQYGMLARGCAAVTPKGHVVLANGDVVLVDGINEPQSLLTGKLKRRLFQTQLDATYYARSFVVANPARNECWICYPRTGSDTPNRAIVWNWDTGAIGTRDLPNATYAASGLLYYPAGLSTDALAGTMDALSGATDQNDFTPNDSRLLLASTAPAIYLADSGSTFAGSSIASLIERTGLSVDAPDMVKTMTSLTPRVSAATGTKLMIQFGGSMSPEVAPTWSDPVPYTVGTSLRAYSFATGRFLAYRIYPDGAQGAFSIKSMDVEIEARGRY